MLLTPFEIIRFDVYTHNALESGLITKEQAKEYIEKRDGRPFDIDQYYGE